MRVRQLLALIAGIALTLSVTGLTGSAAQASVVDRTLAGATAADAPAPPAPDRMPGAVPSTKTPGVLDGSVDKIVQVGNVMIASGLFTTVDEPHNGTQYPRANLFAFDATTGAVSQTFIANTDGEVQQLMPGPTPGTVYVAGDFTKINGKGPNHLQLLDVNTGQQVPGFKAPSTNGGIETMEVLPNNRLFIGGFFTKIGGNPSGQLATLNATTGAVDPFMNITVAGHHNTGSGAKAPIGPRESDVTPAGDRLIVVGNFTTAGGLARNQIVMVDLTGATAAVSTTWATTLYNPICSPNAFDSYMRDVEMSPDGSFFVVSATGGPHSGTLCDNAARFETYATGTALTPTWTAPSGGDTLWGVEVTQSAVYVGGHERWMNNPSGSDSAGQGSVPRPGLVALDPQTGIPLKWNPGRNPRGEAAYDIYETNAGIWVVSNTEFIGDNLYKRPRIAFFPYSEGYNVASKSTGALPGNVYIGAPLSGSSVLYRVDAGGAAIASTDNGPDWAADNGATSTFHNTGSTTASRSSLTAASLVNVPASTPLGIWTTERNDPAGGNEMSWTFPVAAGTNTEVRLYMASRSSSTTRFNVAIDGTTQLSNYNPNTDPGTNKGTMKAFDITSDGTVNIDFTHVSGAGNPLIDAIEIVNLGGTSNANTAKVVNFDGTSVSSQATVNTGTFDWSNVRNGVMIGHTLYYGQTDNFLYSRTFDGTNFGPPVQVNPYIDPAWNTVLTGSGPSTQTYTGVLPTWYSQLPTVTGMFYANGRIYYTRSGQNSLFWRWFSPDSGIIGGVENTVTGGNITWTNTRGMFVNGSTLYVVDSGTGQLLSIPFVNGAPSGTSSVANNTVDWRGRAVFMAAVLPNVAPTAAFTSSCTGLTCDFDASGSSDSDGSITSYSWSFSDGTGAGGPNPEQVFADTGTYDATLTVTDDGGLSSSVTHQVSVVKPNEPPTASFTPSCAYLDCTFDASASTDTDGTITSYAWDFGDGNTGTGTSPEHVYDHPGTYVVSLVVTDDDGATDDTSTSQVVVGAPAPSTVSYVGGAVNLGNVAGPNVTTPSTVTAGDRLLLVLTVNSSTATLSDPAGVTGWTVLDTTTSGSMMTRVYTKIAGASDASKKITVTLGAAAKYTMTVEDYTGVRPGAIVSADLAESVVQAGHTSPVVNAPAGAWVVSYWADKSAATTGFALPGSVTGRQASCGTGSGHICSSLADSAGSVPTGQYGGLTANADTANGTATMWSIILKTQAANQAPTASFTSSCDSTTCSFDGTGSTDPDGSIASYAWDFGDGGTATGATPSHDFVTSGTRSVALTVTDDEGAINTVTIPVTVVRHNANPTASFTTSCTFLVCSFDATASGDTDGTVASYAWDFGDGTTDTTTGATPGHTYAAGGPETVTLTVTDNDGGTGTLTQSISPVAVRPIMLDGSQSSQGNLATPATTVPAGAVAGDRLLMVLSINDPTRTLSNPTGVTGWTQLDQVTSGGIETTVYSKSAAASDPGKTVRVPLDAASKFTLTVAAYSGDILAPQVVKSAETVSTAAHITPTIQADDGDWVVSYWADKSSATTGFALPGSVTGRQAVCGSGSGHICSSLADSGGPVSAGQYGGLTATADSSSASATMWSILLPRAG